jgi:hypothetical protein
MTKASLDVLQAVVLLRRRPQRLGQKREVSDAQRQLAPPGAERDAVDSDEVPNIEPQQPLEASFAELIDARLELDPARTVDEIQKCHLPLLAPSGQSPGHAVRAIRLVASGDVLVRRAYIGDGLGALERVRERLNTRGAQRL